MTVAPESTEKKDKRNTSYACKILLTAPRCCLLFYTDSLLQEQNKETGRKLFIATALMFILPVLTFYVCFYGVFQERAQPENWAGAVAVLVTNMIVGGYVWSAFHEPEEETRSSMEPKTGKVRTD